MSESVFSRCGADSGTAGCPEFWWEGRYYGCIMPEEIIDAELLAASEKTMNLEENRNDSNNLFWRRANREGVG